MTNVRSQIMAETYRIFFRYSEKSKYYPQAVELAGLAYTHQVLGEGADAWHVVTLTDDQLDLMTSLYRLVSKLHRRPTIQGVPVDTICAFCRSDSRYAYVSKSIMKQVETVIENIIQETGRSRVELAEYLDKEYIAPYQNDWMKVRDKLMQEGLIEYYDDRAGTLDKARRKIQEPVGGYRRIRELIAEGDYTGATSMYYSLLGNRYCGELTGELIYLKRLGKIPLVGRDLLYFRTESSRDELIRSHLAEYVTYIDEALERLGKMGRKSPLEVVLECAPTIEQLIDKRKQDWHMGVYLWKGEFKRDSTPVSMYSFSAQFDSCPEGRLFDTYPDQVRHCRVIEYHRDPEYMCVWTTYSPASYRTEILDKGLHVNGIDIYRHDLWRHYGDKLLREPDFMTLCSLADVSKTSCGTRGIEYTGRTHRIGDQDFYEINLIRDRDAGEEVGNPFLELVEEILREAENILRERHGLPRIGEGWVSETQLYQLVLNVFPDAKQHAMPEWLRPQHLDVFVPSKKLAFEYQGRQHFEPIVFFGDQNAFRNTAKRDKLKVQKCRGNSVLLIHWRYDEPLDECTLMEKLRQHGTIV
ncbi:MAG: hypothetical protein QME66_13155 [Candidatus Eisenbacteria bacterium]|nr:hypothetical protein [Candidatus Eisenbacteria bacterium]